MGNTSQKIIPQTIKMQKKSNSQTMEFETIICAGLNNQKVVVFSLNSTKNNLAINEVNIRNLTEISSLNLQINCHVFFSFSNIQVSYF